MSPATDFNESDPTATLSAGEVPYVFCLARRSASPICGIKGFPDGSPVVLIECGDLAAVVTRVRVSDWTGQAGDVNLSHLSWVAPRAFRHEEVIELTMAYSPVCPATFGTIFSSDERLREVVGRHSQTVEAFLTDVEGKDEWDVRLVADPSEIAHKILHERLVETTQAESPGSRYLLEKRLRKEVEAEVQQAVERAIEAIGPQLSLVASDIRLLGRPGVSTDSVGDSPLFAWAVLVPSADRDQFLAAVLQMGNFRGLPMAMCAESGPWPPHHFCPRVFGGPAGSQEEREWTHP